MRRRQFTAALLACAAALLTGCKDVAAPVVSSVKPLMGVYVFCGWANPRPAFGAVPGVQCKTPLPWREIQTLDRRMALGEYDERDPAIARQRVAWMESAGIDFACYQLEWAHEHTQPAKRAPWRPVLDSPLLDSHGADNHPLDTAVRFCVDLWDVSAGDPLWIEMRSRGWTADDVMHSHRMYAREIATRYMNRPNYLTLDDRPVVVRGRAENLQFYASFGITPREITAAWRQEIHAVTGRDPYLLATATEPAVRGSLRAWGFDGLTEYLLQGDGWPDTQETYRYYWQRELTACLKRGLDYWISATAGYDSKAWGSPEKVSHRPTAAQFAAHLQEARSIASGNAGVTRGIVIVYAWNEIGEGGIIEPMAAGQLHDGDEMLRAFRQVCGS